MSFSLPPPILGSSAFVDNSGLSWSDSQWWAQLQPGSWRGVPFVLDVGETHAGRRVAIHEYPYRDTAWVEDLGMLPRRFALQVYQVGDDVYAQRDAMVAACESPGPGTLVHPTLGAVEVVLLDFAVQDRRERGRYVEVQMQFLLASAVRFPATSIASGSTVSFAASSLLSASRSDLALALGTGLVPRVATAIGGFTRMAVSAVSDATRALNCVRGMVGYFGRYAGGRRSTVLPASATVPSLLSDACTSRSAVLTSAANVDRMAGLV
jgi:prophage DNA circulation protein